MAIKNEWVKVDERKLKLSNLRKVLYPDAQIRKAEIIQYYLTVAPVMLHHIKGRSKMNKDELIKALKKK